MPTLQITNEVTRLETNNTQGYGNVPTRRTIVSTTSNVIHQTVQLVSDTHEALSKGDITSTCFVTLENKSTSATISVGLEVGGTFYPLFDIPPGEVAQLPRILSSVSVFVKSSTITGQLLVSLHTIAS